MGSKGRRARRNQQETMNQMQDIAQGQVDYFQELLGDLPEDISDEDLHNHLKKEYDMLKAEFDTWDKDFQSAMKEIPNVYNATRQTHNAIMSRIPTPANWGMGSQYVDMPKTPDPS